MNNLNVCPTSIMDAGRTRKERLTRSSYEKNKRQKTSTAVECTVKKKID